jgi:hypothetical protein
MQEGAQLSSKHLDENNLHPNWAHYINFTEGSRLLLQLASLLFREG